MKNTALYKHQKEILEDQRTHLILAWDTGTGKTIGALELLRKHNVERTLLICPKSLKSKWEEESENFTEGTIDVYTKEEFRKHVKELPQYECIVIDEAHFFAGPKSKLTKSLVWFMKHRPPKRFYGLTATPVLSTWWNIFVFAKHCGMNLHYATFRKLTHYQIKMGKKIVWMQKEDEATEELMLKLMKNFVVTVRADEVHEDLELPITEEITYVTKTQEQSNAILHNFDPVSITMWTNQHCIENGFERDPYVKLPTNKEGIVMDRIKEHKKIAIIGRYRKQMQQIADLVKLHYPERCVYTINGDTEDVTATAKEIEERDDAIVIIQSSISEGYELPSIQYAVFISMSFAYKDFKQMKGRFMRLNKISPIHYEYLLTKGGIDVSVYKTVSKRQNFTFKLYGKENL